MLGNGLMNKLGVVRSMASKSFDLILVALALILLAAGEIYLAFNLARIERTPARLEIVISDNRTGQPPVTITPPPKTVNPNDIY